MLLVAEPTSLVAWNGTARLPLSRPQSRPRDANLVDALNEQRRQKGQDEMQGGCLCGQVRYEMTADPTIVGVCHCRHCQRQGGSAFSVVAAVPASAFRLSGTVETFRDTGDSGKPVMRNFCPICGSPIMSEVTAAPDLVWVKTGSLDDPSRLRPTMQIYCDKAQPWIALEGLESYPGMPDL